MAADVLITGATGLIGSWVMRHGETSGLSGSLVPIQHDEVDLLAPGAPARMIRSRVPSAVVHLAWCASGNADYRTSEENEEWVRSSIELVRACRQQDTALWLTGSVAEEAPSEPYAASKLELRQAVSDEIDSARVGWLRPTHVFDEERRRPALLEHALTQRERGRAVTLRNPGDGHDFIHASDVGRAILVAVQHGLLGLVPIGSGVPRTVAGLVDALGVRWESAPDVRVGVPGASDVADTQRLRRHGWTPTRTNAFFASSVDQGIAR